MNKYVLTQGSDTHHQELRYGFFDLDIGGGSNPTWKEIEQALYSLDGLTVEIVTIYTDSIGQLAITMPRGQKCYYLEYLPEVKYPHPGIPWHIFPIHEPGTLLLEMTIPIPDDIEQQFPPEKLLTTVRHFANHGTVPSTTIWRVIDSGDHNFSRFFYRDDNEALLELGHNTSRRLMQRRVQHYASMGKPFNDLMLWQNILHDNTSSEQDRLAAICLLGRSNIPEMQQLLLPFLTSQDQRERWVSARYLGELGIPNALPVLISMLTEPTPHCETKADECWYNFWRSYAPRLLRHWQHQHPATIPALRKACKYHLQQDSGPMRDCGYNFLDILCYELGRLGGFDLFESMSLLDARVRVALVHMAQGYYAMSRNLSAKEEIETFHPRTLDQHRIVELCSILNVKCGLSPIEAFKLLRQFANHLETIYV